METAILARHAESAFNARGVLNGDLAVAGALSERGEQEARRLGDELAGDEIDLCATSEFERARQTADLALAGRDVPRLVVPELNEIGFGRFEGGSWESYRDWAGAHAPAACPGGGESRADCVRRYVRGYGLVLARPERTVLVVAHGLTLRYVLNAADGTLPAPLLDGVPCATPFRLDVERLRRAVDALEAWSAEPAWRAAS